MSIAGVRTVQDCQQRAEERAATCQPLIIAAKPPRLSELHPTPLGTPAAVINPSAMLQQLVK
jgi:hypothetical protein